MEHRMKIVVVVIAVMIRDVKIAISQKNMIMIIAGAGTMID